MKQRGSLRGSKTREAKKGGETKKTGDSTLPRHEKRGEK